MPVILIVGLIIFVITCSSALQKAGEKHARRDMRRRMGAERKGCFIATAIYPPFSEELQLLRILRDNLEEISGFWQGVFEVYYRVSPPIADYLSKHPYLSKLIRFSFLTPLVNILKRSGHLSRRDK